jgi:hypothetical protein
MMKILVPVALAIMLLSTPASATDGQSFADAVVGNSVLGKTGDGKKWAAYYKTGGEMTFNLDNGWSDSGKWWVDGEKFCQQWEQVRGGAKYCLAGC